jgi:periplasmic divalent cation tolerance protein
MMNETLEVKTTTAEHSSAMKIARALVEQRLAACVQVSGPIESVYRWQGSVETSQEWLCTAKTTSAAFPRVQKLIRELHSYDEPEIIATAIDGGSDTYLHWLKESVAP